MSETPDWSQVATKADLESVRRGVTALTQTVSKIQGQLTGLYWFIGAAFVALGILQGLPYLSQWF